jgi:hypothetical protein
VSNELVSVERAIIRVKRNLAQLERQKRRVSLKEWLDKFDSAWEQTKLELEDLMTLKAFVNLSTI